MHAGIKYVHGDKPRVFSAALSMKPRQPPHKHTIPFRHPVSFSPSLSLSICSETLRRPAVTGSSEALPAQPQKDGATTQAQKRHSKQPLVSKPPPRSCMSKKHCRSYCFAATAQIAPSAHPAHESPAVTLLLSQHFQRHQTSHVAGKPDREPR